MNKKILKFVNEVPGLLSIDEGVFLENAAKSTEKLKGVLVEIGSFCGKSTIFLAQSKNKIYSVDPHKGFVEPGMVYPGTYKKFIKNIRDAGVYSRIVPLVNTSKGAAKNWNKKIKFLFIDGLHDDKNAMMDFALWSRHLIDGGIVAVHDSFLRWCGSEKVAVSKIVNSPDFYKIGFSGSMIYGVKGKGSVLNRLNKLFMQIIILTAIYLNRLGIVIFHLPSILKQKISTRTTGSHRKLSI